MFHSRPERVLRTDRPIHVGYLWFPRLSSLGWDPFGFATLQKRFPDVATQKWKAAWSPQSSRLGRLNGQAGEVL